MPSIHDTAYPRLKSSLSDKELNAVFTPTAEEFELAHSIAKSTPLRIVFLVLLKTFQRLGYFLPLHKVPRLIAEHISLIYGVHYEAMEWEAYDASGSRYRFIASIREHLGIKDFDPTAQQILSAAIEQAALLREDLADIINIGIEELVRIIMSCRHSGRYEIRRSEQGRRPTASSSIKFLRLWEKIVAVASIGCSRSTEVRGTEGRSGIR
jgi:hypothetical protein